MAESTVSEIVDRYNRDPSFIIAMLQDVQEEHKYLPKEVLEELSRELEVPLARTFSIATFYNAFSLEPKGDHPICVCMGTACHVRGASKITEKIEREIGIKSGETTADKKFSLEEVRCLGCCGLAPVVTVGDDLYGKVTQAKIPRILKKYRDNGKAAEAETEA